MTLRRRTRRRRYHNWTNQLYLPNGDWTIGGVRYDENNYWMMTLTANPSSVATATLVIEDLNKFGAEGAMGGYGNWTYTTNPATCTGSCSTMVTSKFVVPSAPGSYPGQPGPFGITPAAGFATSSPATCGAWVASGAWYALVTPGYPMMALPLPSSVGGNGGHFGYACNWLQNQVGNILGGAAKNCLCEPETAAYMFGALGPGNAEPYGNGPFGPFSMATVVNTCNALGYTDIYWPQNGVGIAQALNGAAIASPGNNCGNASQPVPFPTPLLVPGSARQPYVMTPTTSSVIIRWRSATPTASVVSYGTSVSSLTGTVTNAADAAGVLEHSVKLTGLTAGTTYYYAAGSASSTTTTAAFTFKTAPPTGTAVNTRIWTMGDFGEVSQGQPVATVSDAGREQNVYTNWLAYEASSGRAADMFVALGDNAYNTGSDSLYQVREKESGAGTVWVAAALF